MSGEAPLAPFKDIIGWFPDYKPDVIFDVGAFVGNFSRLYARAFPEAKVYSFEPHPVTFQTLKANMAQLDNVVPMNLAMSDTRKVVRMTDRPVASSNRVTPDGTLDIQATNVAIAMDGLKLKHLSYLKIDAEGHDLEVLKGAPLPKIDFVQVETMMNRHDPQGTFFVPVYEYMIKNGFYLFNMYDFIWEWKRGTRTIKVALGDGKPKWANSGAPITRRVDTVFINPKFVSLTDEARNTQAN